MSMHISLKDDFVVPKPNISSVHSYGRHPRLQTEEDQFQEGLQEGDSQNDQFSLSVTSRNQQPEVRTIRRSMVNRSCINTCSYSCRNLSQIPSQMKDPNLKLGGVQKIDLSFNNLASLAGLRFEQFGSLKELMLNDNRLGELPHNALNCCRQLRLVNISNNQLSLLPPLTSPSFILARGNPLRLVTAQLHRLLQIEFVTFDWLDYLLDNVTSQSQGDHFKQYAHDYNQFRKTILNHVDYEREQNCSYCDFHCFYSVRLEEWRGQKQGSEGILAMQAAKAILRGDSFFLNYLRNYHNEVNFAALTYNSRLLLETALETGKSQALDLFKLRKSNYAVAVDQQVYFNSLRACCRHNSYDIFKYLVHIRSRRRVLQTQAHLAVLIKEVIEKYNKERQSDKILIQLIRFWKEATKGKIVVKIPVQFSHRLFKSLSAALLDILTDERLNERFQLEPQLQKTTPLHFAMRSRNEELVKKLIQTGSSVFETNYIGQTCKFAYGSTQVSRKMVWQRQKNLIKQFWKSNIQSTPAPEKSILSSARSIFSAESVNGLVQSRIGYESLHGEFLLYRKPATVGKKLPSLGQKLSQFTEEELIPHIQTSIKAFRSLSWRKDYLKKMVHCDISLFLLSQISYWRKDEDYLARVDRFGKLYLSLFQLFGESESLEENLIKYELMQTMLQLTGTENISQKPIKGGNFWCCQNVVFQ